METNIECPCCLGSGLETGSMEHFYKEFCLEFPGTARSKYERIFRRLLNTVSVQQFMFDLVVNIEIELDKEQKSRKYIQFVGPDDRNPPLEGERKLMAGLKDAELNSFENYARIVGIYQIDFRLWHSHKGQKGWCAFRELSDDDEATALQKMSVFCDNLIKAPYKAEKAEKAKLTLKERLNYWFSRSGDELAKLSEFLEENEKSYGVNAMESLILRLKALERDLVRSEGKKEDKS